ncbi:hypothetical protein GUITHDRAFT_122536 [Guillardia theta CCMP2712]|uniref:Zn(2)-C6 fungal-type domain-containing protein n=1 Tax=Guillardia theta (strain CCMP2712) TaxID=905079 RepID=L1I4S2_GUITC|nr:hypothetical protein GUITHDRAFT_122536 [Guillardia theta CCMP2712]EKX31263.1 hypothetical protein GUITHDRAFT_122536 [Guillardia theta CCMP2712]|eukprot:XP_005818243.1 hypothetical protein GUITHDRAFT_122536 [Guillardia theta CCMP2712]
MENLGDDDDLRRLLEESLKRPRSQGRACTRCRRQKLRCDRLRPCLSCITRGCQDECDAEMGATSCLSCKVSKTRCDKSRPCSTCIARGKVEECRNEPTNKTSADNKESRMENEITKLRGLQNQRIQNLQDDVTSPWTPLSPESTGILDALLPLVVASSRAGYSEPAVLRLINAMGPDLRGVLGSLAETVGELNAARARAGEGLRGRDASRTSEPPAAEASSRGWASWRVHWGPGEAQRGRTEVTRGLEGLWEVAGAGEEQAGERHGEEGLVERELPTSDVEYVCMLVDELLSSGEARAVSYHRLCGRSAGGLLEDSMLVRSTVEREEDETGRVVSSLHTVEAVETEEWERIQGSAETRSTYMQLRRYLGEEPTGEDVVRTHRTDMLFGEDFGSMSETREGRERMERMRSFFEEQLSALKITTPNL